MPKIDQLASTFVAVMVLYKETADDSSSFRTLMASMRSLEASKQPAQVLLYDNTPGAADPGPLPQNVRYEAIGQNTGLAAAYNRALHLAGELGASWLLLLDQDTALPLNFLDSLRGQIERWQSNEEIVAFVPLVRSRGVIISPMRVGFFGLKPLGNVTSGPIEGEMMAINSGTAVRCDFVRSIGGFSSTYWLDYLDHWFFRQVYKHRKKAVVFDSVLEHNLSVQDYRRNIDLRRYRSILAGEAAFMTSHKPKLQIPFYLVRLAVRIARMTVQGQPDLALFTMKTIVRIALHPLRSLEENPS